MSSETRKVVPQFPFPPKELYEPFQDSSYVQDPPRPPDRDSEYVIFGVSRRIQGELLPSLESQGHRILFKPTEKKTESVKLLILSCVKRYMNILDNLSTWKPDWSTIEQQLQIIEEQFVNIYHLLNLLRIDQAKWRLYKLFNSQVSKKEALAEELKGSRNEALFSLKSDTQSLLGNVEWKESLNSFLSHQRTEEEALKEKPHSFESRWDMRETIKSILSRNECE